MNAGTQRDPEFPWALAVADDAPVVTVLRSPAGPRGLAVVAHHDALGAPDEPFRQLLAGLADAGLTPLVVSTAPFPHDDVTDAVADHACAVVTRANAGFDFLSWHRGMQVAHRQGWLPAPVVLTNSSVYGPLWPLAPLLERMSPAPVWGMVESLQIRRHVQSWWIAADAAFVARPEFGGYWAGVQPYREKWGTILGHELPWAQQLADDRVQVVVSAEQAQCGERNPMLAAWRRVTGELGVPFLKKRLFVEDSADIDPTGWREFLAAVAPRYDSSVIERDLRRRGLREAAAGR